MKNNKGFTLVELLATIVILGIIMVVAVPNVTGILSNNRSATYISDAKKLVSTTEYVLRKESSTIAKPGNGECIVFSLGYLDNGEFNNPPNDGEYSREYSYVIVKRNGTSMEYYVQLLEKITNRDDSVNYRGWLLSKNTDLEADGAKTKIENKNQADLIIINETNKSSISTGSASCTITKVYFE